MTDTKKFVFPVYEDDLLEYRLPPIQEQVTALVLDRAKFVNKELIKFIRSLLAEKDAAIFSECMNSLTDNPKNKDVRTRLIDLLKEHHITLVYKPMERVSDGWSTLGVVVFHKGEIVKTIS